MIRDVILHDLEAPLGLGPVERETELVEVTGGETQLLKQRTPNRATQVDAARLSCARSRSPASVSKSTGGISASSLITTNTAFSEWGNILSNTTIATAIADRLVENSGVFLLGGDSFRKQKTDSSN